jgi:CRP/FNR family cyclic AMP-dependent transcriptional regulator
MSNTLTAALRASSLCRLLSAGELEVIAGIAEERKFAAGESLFREGDPGDGVYLLLSGEIEVVKSAGGSERALARLASGGVLGEMSLLTNDTRSATGRACVETSVVRIPAARFRTLLAEGAPAALKVTAGLGEVLARRLAATNAKVMELAEKLESVGGKVPPMKEEQLAELHRTLQVWSF